jgi:hypothetical protein
MKMQKREIISSNFIGLKSISILFMVVSPYIFFIQDGRAFKDAIIPQGFIWLISIAILIFCKTRDKIEYDGNMFYITNWKGVERVVTNERIIAMLQFGIKVSTFSYTFRFIYNSENNSKKQFWLYPNFRVNLSSFQKKLKETNPNILISNESLGGIEHLFFKDEKWFK